MSTPEFISQKGTSKVNAISTNRDGPGRKVPRQAVVGSWHSTLAFGWLSGSPFVVKDDARRSAARSIEQYNITVRRRSASEMRSPVESEEILGEGTATEPEAA